MTQSALKPGVYVFYAGDRGNNSIGLFQVHYDGKYANGPTEWTVGLPNLIGAPCAFLDRDGAYAGDGVTRIHVFAPVVGNQLWWLTTTDGANFVVHNFGVSNITTRNKAAVLLLEDGVHMYYTDANSNWVSHAWSYTDWNFQSSEPIIGPAAWGCAAVVRDGAPNIVFNDNGNNAVRVFWLSQRGPHNQGGGTWTENSPTGSTLKHSPAAALLGDTIFVTHHGQGGDQQLYYETNSWNSSGWVADKVVPGVQMTNSPGMCVWGDRLYCAYQRADQNPLYCQVYIGDSWLSTPVQFASNTPAVWWGPCAVAVGP